jgi:hypothetical protein
MSFFTQGELGLVIISSMTTGPGCANSFAMALALLACPAGSAVHASMALCSSGASLHASRRWE